MKNQIRFNFCQFLTAPLLLLGGIYLNTDAASAAGQLDGKWLLQSLSRHGSSSSLPQGDSVLLSVRGTEGEIIMTPNHPGQAEMLIKNLCTDLHGLGKIHFDKKNQATFHVTQVKGNDKKIFCPATQVLSQIAGKDVAAQLQNNSFKFDFQYKKSANQLTITTFYKNDPVDLSFKKQQR